MTKVLVIRFSSIGDAVLTTPVIRCIKNQLDQAEVHVLTKTSFSSLFSSNPNVDKVFGLKDDEKELVSELKKENYDYIIDLHKNIRTLYFKQKLRRKAFSFSKLNVQKWLAVNIKNWPLPDIHIVDRYFDAVQSIGVKNDQKGLDFFIPKKDRIDLSSYFDSSTVLAVVIGAKFATKSLPTDKLISILQRVHAPSIALLGGEEEKAKGDEIKEALKAKKTHNFCGELHLNQSASVVEQADVLLTHDTGLMHIASAFNIPIVSVWGNTIPEFGMYPYRPNDQTSFSIHEVKELACRPCSKIGYQKCPKKHFKCMENQDVDGIIDQIDRFLS